MKKRVMAFFVIFSFICLSVIAFNFYCSAENNQSKEQIKNFTEKYGKNVKINWNKITGFPRWISGIETESYEGNSEEITFSFLSENSSFLGIDVDDLKLRDDLIVVKRVKHVHFKQFYKGLPVENAEISVYMNGNGAIGLLQSNYYPILNLNINPLKKSEEAATVIKEDLGIEKLLHVKTSFAEDGTEKKEFLPVVPELIIIPKDGGNAYLAWAFNFCIEDSRGARASWHYSIDAHTGQIIRKRSLDQAYGPYYLTGNVEGYIFPTDGDDDTSKEDWHLAKVTEWFLDPGPPPFWVPDYYTHTEPDGDYSLTYYAPYNTWHYFSVQTSGTKCQASSAYYGGIPSYNTVAYPYYDLPDYWNPNVNWSDVTYSKLDNNNVFYHVTNALEDYYYDVHGIDLGFSMIGNVHIPNATYGQDYAWYDASNNTINFGIGGTRFNNGARARDVVLHELQHLVTDLIFNPFPYSNPTYSQLVLNESWSDYFSSTITGDPNCGEWFFKDSNSVRHIDVDYEYPDDWNGSDDIYNDSLIPSSTLWDIRDRIGQGDADTLTLYSIVLEPYSLETLRDACEYLGEYILYFDSNTQDAVSRIFGEHGID